MRGAGVKFRSVGMTLAAISIAGALQACATAPQEEHLAQPRELQSYKTTQVFTASVVEWPEENWWRRYGDPQLDALIQAGLSNSPTMASAQARIRAAEAAAQQSKAAITPSATLNGQALDQKTSGNLVVARRNTGRAYDLDWTPQATLNFAYEFDFWGKNRKLLAAATSDAFAARADASAASLSLSTSIAAAYGEYRRLELVRSVNEDAIRIKQRTLDIVLRRIKSGLDADTERTQAQAGLYSARADLAATNELIALQRDQLAYLVSGGPDFGLSIVDPVVPKLPTSLGLPVSLPLDLLGRRPDLVAARARIESAKGRTAATRADFYPNLNLSALVGVQSVGVSRLSLSQSAIANFGPALKLPLFDGGRLAGAYRTAEANSDLAVASYNSALDQALKDVADAIQSQRALEVRHQETEAAYQVSTRAYQGASRRYAAGLTAYVNVLTAETSLISAQRALNDLDARGFTLDVQLVKALGGGFSSPTSP